MTKDEAYKIAAEACYPQDDGGHQSVSMMIVNSLDALGMLKLDEPKSAAQKFADIAHKLFGATGYIQLWDSLEKNGLRIVEK